MLIHENYESKQRTLLLNISGTLIRIAFEIVYDGVDGGRFNQHHDQVEFLNEYM